MGLLTVFRTLGSADAVVARDAIYVIAMLALLKFATDNFVRCVAIYSRRFPCPTSTHPPTQVHEPLHAERKAEKAASKSGLLSSIRRQVTAKMTKAAKTPGPPTTKVTPLGD